jgi:hypothetical protein
VVNWRNNSDLNVFGGARVRGTFAPLHLHIFGRFCSEQEPKGRHAKPDQQCQTIGSTTTFMALDGDGKKRSRKHNLQWRKVVSL